MVVKETGKDAILVSRPPDFSPLAKRTSMLSAALVSRVKRLDEMNAFKRAYKL